MLEKLLRRIKFIKKSTPFIYKAFFNERKDHPWRYIFDYWFLPSEKRYKKSEDYLRHSLKGLRLSNQELHLKEITIPLPVTERNQTLLLGILAEYFDFIYPKTVKYPIPFFVSEGPYEKDGCVIKEGDVVIDAGANLGLFSWLMSNTVGRKGRLYLFEPIDSLTSIITNTIKENKLEDQVFLTKKALSDKDETLYFTVDDFSGGSHRSANGTKEIPATTIDTFVRENNIPKIDFIKADIEGMEPNLIQGAKQTITRDKPRIAICTYHDKNHRHELTEMLKSYRPDYRFSYSSHKLFAW